MSPRNVIITNTGKQRAVCELCGKQSRPVELARLGYLAVGWSELPFPADYVHTDGSTGSLFRCPLCGDRRDFPISPKLDR